jgi:hypothetical protein
MRGRPAGKIQTKKQKTKQLQTGRHVPLPPSPATSDDDEPNYVDSEPLVFSQPYQPDIDELDNEREVPQGSMPESDLMAQSSGE